MDLFHRCGPFPSFPVAFIPFSLLISLPGLSPFFHHPLQLPCPHYLLSSRVPPRFGPAAGEGFQPTAPGKNPLSRSGAATRCLGLPSEYQRYAWDHRMAGKLGCSPPSTAPLLPGRDAGDGAGCCRVPARGMQLPGHRGGGHTVPGAGETRAGARPPPAPRAGFVAPSSGDTGGCRRSPGSPAPGGRPGTAPGSPADSNAPGRGTACARVVPVGSCALGRCSPPWEAIRLAAIPKGLPGRALGAGGCRWLDLFWAETVFS